MSISISGQHLPVGSPRPGLCVTSHHGAEASFDGGNKATWINRGRYQNARNEGYHEGKCPSYIFNYFGGLWLIPNGQIRKCKSFFQSARVISMQEFKALCLEQLFIIKKIKMMYCILYSISRDQEDYNTWNKALSHPFKNKTKRIYDLCQFPIKQRKTFFVYTAEKSSPPLSFSKIRNWKMTKKLHYKQFIFVFEFNICLFPLPIPTSNQIPGKYDSVAKNINQCFWHDT